MRIVDLLGRGQSGAVPISHLISLTGMDNRTVRRMIEAERRQGIPILSDNCRGYFLPADEDEIAACVRSLRRRAGKIMRTARAIENAGKGVITDVHGVSD